MEEENEEIKFKSLIPRCIYCGTFAHYVLVNKKTNQSIPLCENHGLLTLMMYKNSDEWEIIILK